MNEREINVDEYNELRKTTSEDITDSEWIDFIRIDSYDKDQLLVCSRVHQLRYDETLYEQWVVKYYAYI